MNVIVIGLGSMGKRRLRCLHALGYSRVCGVESRADRRAEVEKAFGIRTYATLEEATSVSRADALIISVPPDVHHVYMEKAVAAGTPFFVEASVVDTGLLAIDAACTARGLLAAPSSTMIFYPGIRLIADLIKSNALGKISNIIHHSGQYLPDWHVYEKVEDYYVSNPATGGAREIVPFELSWLTSVFGFPNRVAANHRKTVAISGAEKIDDTYNCLFDYGSFLMVLVVDVVSRAATRRLVINGDKKQLYWNWDDRCVKIFDPATGKWEELTYDQGHAAAGYNANIGETMYIEELKTFLDAAQGRGTFPNTLKNDHANLRLLYAAEESDRTGRHVSFAP
jgi:predicted dehydrogenase